MLTDQCIFKLDDPFVDESLGSGEGYRMIRIQAKLDGEPLDKHFAFKEGEIGSIKVAWIDPDEWYRKCTTPLHYLALRRWYKKEVHATLCEHGDLTDLTDEEAEHLVEKLKTKPSFRWMDSFEPKKALEMAQEEHRNWWQIAVDQLVGNPYVDYIKVRPKFRCQGLAKALYALAGCYLATKGYTLRGSTCQSPDAGRVWASMVDDPTYPTRPIQLGDNHRFLLDYRRQSEHKNTTTTKKRLQNVA